MFDDYCQGPKLGTGLGLPLSRSLVKLLGGELRFHVPESGVGSSFTFSYPCARQTAAAEPATGDVVSLPSGMRVLVADDLKVNRKLLIRLLKTVLPTPQVEEASTAAVTLQLLLEKPFDIAFIDEHFVENAELTGTEITARVRAHEQARSDGASRVVILGVTGMEDTVHTKWACAQGQDEVLGKPFPSGATLRKILHRLLSN